MKIWLSERSEQRATNYDSEQNKIIPSMIWSSK